jgi:predicted amidophosphoribosyltransferase
MSESAFRMTPAVYATICPKCDEPASRSVNLGLGETYYCDDCGTRWQRGDRDACARCEKPLGSSDVVCHACRDELAAEGP